MKKHGASHGAAVLVCTLISALLIDIVRKHVPSIYNGVDRFSRFFIDLFGLQYAADNLSILLYATTLAIIWGIAFSFMHSDKA